MNVLEIYNFYILQKNLLKLIT